MREHGPADAFVEQACGVEASRLILQAANDLQLFDLRDLCNHTRLPLDVIETYVRARADLIMKLERPHQGFGANGPKTHRLVPSQSSKVAEWLARTAAADVPERGADMGGGRSVLQMLEATVAALSSGAVPHEDFEFELNVARRQLAGATRDLDDRRRMGLAAEAGEEARLFVARNALARLDAQRDRSAHEARELPVTVPAETVKQIVFDWTFATPDLSAAAHAASLSAWLAAYSAEQLVDRLVSPALPIDALMFAGGLALAAPAANGQWQPLLAEVLADRLQRIGAADAPTHLPVLAVTSALLDAGQAAEPTFVALLRFRSLLPRSGLALCCAALGRLGMPWGATTPVKAAVASACAHLLSHCPDLPSSSVLSLGATALNANSVDTRLVLHKMAGAMWVITMRATRPPYWQAPLRNVAMSLMLQSRVDQFSRDLEGLLDVESGPHFVTLLGEAEAEAFDFIEVDRRDSDFAVRVHSRIMGRAIGRPRIAKSFPLGVREGSPHFEFFKHLVGGRPSPQGMTEVRRRLRHNAAQSGVELRA